MVGTAWAESIEGRLQRLEGEIAALKGEKSDLSALSEPADKLHFGGYGEIHTTLAEGGKKEFDIHRLVMYVGYDFNEWIKLVSETEIEHAFVNGGNGDLVIEQLYADFLLADAFNIRAGRMLAPLGIINEHHEPPLFLGVERPNVEKNIIPSTWSVDGIGIFGSPLSWLSYKLYFVSGLDGSEFSAGSGIRSGRIKERGSFQDPAVTGRIDLYPFEEQDLRIGISGYYGGTNNKNKGGEHTGTNDFSNTFTMYSADFEYNVSRFRFRGVVAHGENSDAEDLPNTGVGEEIFGWYLESGMDVMPESWKNGKLAEAAIIPFVRYEEYDTQYRLPSAVTASGANDRTEVTLGVNVPLSSQFVVKVDCLIADTEEVGSDTSYTYNLGMGWVLQ